MPKTQGAPIDVYVRVSRVGRREARLISPDEQERRARDHAREHGLRVGVVLTDLDESGGKLDRPGLTEALRRVEAGESGGLILAWLDRLSRDSEHAQGLLRRISEAGGAIYAPDAPANMTAPEGELQVGILFAFAQYVRQRAGAGFERAKAQAIERGIPVSTRPAVGYRQREDRRLEPDPRAAPIVREVFERRAAGAGPAELATLLEDNDVRTSQGSGTWSKQAVYNLLRSRVYLGELRYGRDDRYVNPNAIDRPIVDIALWSAAQHPDGRSLGRVSDGSPWLLTGLLRCAACRYCVQGTTTSRGKRIYRCTRRHAGGVCPSPVRVAADGVEDASVGAFWQITRDLEAERQVDHRAADLSRLEVAFEKADQALKRFIAPEVQDAVGDMAEYTEGLRDRRERRDRAAEALGRARAAVAAPTIEVPGTETLRSAWERMDTRDRRELLSLRIDCIALCRDPIGIVVYPAGTGPANLPRRGFKRAPVLAPFPDPPDGARRLAL